MTMLRKLVFLSALGLLLAMLSPVQAQDGQVLWEFWFGGITDQVETLLADPRFPYGPDLTEYSTSFTADKPDQDYYGGRGRAYLIPPETGEYTIWVWSDDDSNVYLSTDDNPANAELVAYVSGWTPADAWTNYASQKSAPRVLEAGQRYYIEGVYADGTGGGNIGVGWSGPGIGDDPVIIDGQYLSAFVVTRHPAFKPDPANGAVDVTSQLFTWSPGTTAVAHDVYFGTDPNLGPDTAKGRIGYAMYYAMDTLSPGAQYYWRVDEVEADGVTIHQGDVWTFTVQPLTAHFPNPADGALWVSTTLTPSWTAGQNAASYTVYGAPIREAVEAGLDDAKLGVTEETSFDATGLLDPATTYYWRVDTTDINGDVHPGDVWTFSTFDPAGGAVAEYWDNMTLSGAPKVVTTVGTINFDWGDGPTQGVNSPDPNIPTNLFSCRWTAQLNVPYTGKYTIYEASDDGARTFLNGQQICAGWVDRGTTEDASAQLDLVAGGQYLLVMEMYENGGGATAFLRWSGPGIAKSIIPQGALVPPKMAFSPSPASGTANLEANKVVLSWSAGVDAVQHNVYLGTDPNLVAAADASVFQGTVDTASFTPVVDWESVYYWRVDEVAADGTVTPGLVWSFSTRAAVATSPADWEVVADGAAPTFLAMNVENGTYDIGTYGGEQTYEFLVRSNPAETMTSMCLIGRLNYGDTKAGLKFEQWENTGTYGATLFGVADYDFGVANNPGIPTDVVFVSSTATNTTALYVDGVYKASLDVAISLSGEVGIGRAIRQDGTFVDNFDGTIVAVAIYDRALSVGEIRAHADAYFLKGPSDITAPGDVIKGIPESDVCGGDSNVNVSPCGELPPNVIDDSASTKYLNFKGDFDPNETASGFAVTPALGATVVTGLTFTSANDSANRDPIAFELYGSNDSIDGPWTLIASGDIVDFAQATEWPRNTINATPITFKNKDAYLHYQVLFTAVRDPATANSMQIAEVELIGRPDITLFSEGFESYEVGSEMHGQGGWKGWDNVAAASAPVSSDQAASGVNSVQIIGSSDLVHEFGAKGGVVEFSVMQYIPSGSTGTTFCILMNQYADGGPDDWSDQTEFRMDSATVHFADGQETPIVFDQWVQVKYVICLDNNTVDRYYNGELIGSGQWDDTGHNTFQAVDLFGNGAAPVYYDDILLR
jgi:hypothetical protein